MIKLINNGEVFAAGNTVEEIVEELNESGDWYYVYRPDASVVDTYFATDKDEANSDTNGENADEIYDVIEDE